jgi:hypothetical protein
MKASDEPLTWASDHPVLKQLKSNPYCYQTLRHRMNRCLTIGSSDSHFWISSRRTHSTQLESRASDHPTLLLWFQLIQFKCLWVFRQFFCFQCVSMSTLSCLASKKLECAYFHGFWCMVKILVHESILIVRSNTISLWHFELTKSLAL